MDDTTTDIDDIDDEIEEDDDDTDDAVDDVDEDDGGPVALYDRDGIESADDTGLIAGEELITNAQFLQGLSGKV
jgi:hypothetical protein